MVVKVRLSLGILGAGSRHRICFSFILYIFTDWGVFLQVFLFTIIAGVNPFGQQEAAELVFSVDGVLDFHQVGGHAEGIILQVPLALLTTTGNSSEKQPDSNGTNLKLARWCDLTLFQLTTRGRYCPSLPEGKTIQFCAGLRLVGFLFISADCLMYLE